MRLAVVDIEATSLKADRGFVLCVGVKPLGEPEVMIGYAVEPLASERYIGVAPERSRYTIDRALVRRAVEEMARYDGWITWNGLLYDLPYLDDRAVIAELPRRPPRAFARGLDFRWHAAAPKSTFQSSKLDWVAKTLRCPARKTELDQVVWAQAEAEALRGFRDGSEAYQQIVEHCRADLVVTEWVYHRLRDRVKTISRW